MHPNSRNITDGNHYPVFFTHCHPARLIFHKPTFTAALTHGVVPPYLVFAMCALAAPLSKQPRLRTSPARYAGRPFAQEALSLMFDGAGRLVCEPSLAVAQALCLLQIHDTRVGGATAWNMRYHGAFGSFTPPPLFGVST